MTLLLEALFAWRTVRDVGCWVYQQNDTTGFRRVLPGSWVKSGYQPLDMDWLLFKR